MTTKTEKTFWVKIYMSGPIEAAKQVCRAVCHDEGLCVTIDPTHFIYTGGEEAGFVVGLINYPRFPKMDDEIMDTAKYLVEELLLSTHQHSALIMTPDITEWTTSRAQ
jgi:hypothetical protein